MFLERSSAARRGVPAGPFLLPWPDRSVKGEPPVTDLPVSRFPIVEKRELWYDSRSARDAGAPVGNQKGRNAMFASLEPHTKQILTGNLLMILCCVFYLAWWLIAYKPQGAVKGMKSGWLLIPAFVLGVAGFVVIARGASSAAPAARLMPGAWIGIGGSAAYVILLAATSGALHRPVTTELLLIVGWTTLMFWEMNVLYGLGEFGRTGAVSLLAVIVISAVISLICYLLYYNLDAVKGYADGTVPLVLTAVMMAVVDLCVIL